VRVGYIYSLYDVKTGALLHEGTPDELVQAGVFTRRSDASHKYLKQKRQVKAPRRWRIERRPEPAKKKAKPEERPKGTQKRRIWVYSLFDAEGNQLAKGTAKELVELGRFNRTQDVANAYYAKQSIERGVYSLTRELEERYVAYSTPGAKLDPPKKSKAVKRAAIRCIENPDALQADIHDLCIYNEKARKAGKKELSYGYWAAAGKPARPAI